MTTPNTTIAVDRAFKLLVSTSEGIFFFNPEDITRLEAKSNYTFMYFANRKPLLISKVLKTYDQVLSPVGFLRTHSSHLVNKKYISSIGSSGEIVMNDDSRVGISRRKRKEVVNEIVSFFGRN